MADPELNKAEDEMKAKYLPLIRNLSHVELKHFNKNDYKKKVLRDMSKLHPSYDTTVLDGYAQCVSNALQSEAQTLLKHWMRQTSATEQAEPLGLSDTVLEALDFTMQGDIYSSLPLSQVMDDDDSDDGNDDGNGDDEVNSDYEICDEATGADDSTTLLKQPVNTESSTNGNGSNLVARCSESTIKTHQCCESCTVNPKSKKKLGMIQCNVCMSWFHEQCVGLDKNSEPVGIWLCMTCREFPKMVTTELSVMKNELYDLKQSTTSILTAVKCLTSNIERSIGNINDRLTAINNRISTNDKSVTGAIQTLTTTTSNIKTSVDQKSCQILNKTSTILDKVKTTQTELSKQSTVTDKQCETNTLIENRQQTPSIQNSSLNQRRSQREGAPKNGHVQQDQQLNKNQINKNQNGQTKQKPTHDKMGANQEIIDLTKNMKPVKKLNTLLFSQVVHCLKKLTQTNLMQTRQ